jgi:CheY-like chemotaxis protein
VTEVGTGQEALDNAAAADVILLHVHLPDMSGFEVCAQDRLGRLHRFGDG